MICSLSGAGGGSAFAAGSAGGPGGGTAFAAREVAIEDILFFTGAGSEEELTSEDIAEYSGVRFNINRVGGAGGLFFSEYQLMALEDYISRHGALLSAAELRAVGCFSEEFIYHLIPFIYFEEDGGYGSGGGRVEAGFGGGAGGRGWRRVSQEVSAQGGDKVTLEGKLQNQYLYSLRYKLDCGDRGGVVASVHRGYSGANIPDMHLSGSWSSRDGRLRIVGGDFKVRFGQGLAAYDGLSFSSVYTIAALEKRTTGIRPSSSFSGSGSKTGAALEGNFGRQGRIGVWVWSYTPWVRDGVLKGAVENSKVEPFEVTSGARVAWRARGFTLGATGVWDYRGATGAGSAGGANNSGAGGSVGGTGLTGRGLHSGKVAVDIAGSFGSSFYLWGEACYQPMKKLVEGVVGCKYSGWYGVTPGVRLLLQQGNIQGNVVVEGLPSRSVKITGSGAYIIKKSTVGVKGNVECTWSKGMWDGKARVYYTCSGERKEGTLAFYRGLTHKVLAKCESTVKWPSAKLGVGLQGNIFLAEGSNSGGTEGLNLSPTFGVMPYLLGGYSGEKVKVTAQAAWWHAPKWDNRLWLYLYDLPESFSVPALYKDGLLGNIFISAKLGNLGGSGKQSTRRRQSTLKLYGRLTATYYFKQKLTLEAKFGLNYSF